MFLFFYMFWFYRFQWYTQGQALCRKKHTVVMTYGTRLKLSCSSDVTCENTVYLPFYWKMELDWNFSCEIYHPEEADYYPAAWPCSGVEVLGHPYN